nr:MAG TPA: hypothetical protein [Caudoviricetes sp.]
MSARIISNALAYPLTAAVLSASPMRACGKYVPRIRPPGGPGACGWIIAK